MNKHILTIAAALLLAVPAVHVAQAHGTEAHEQDEEDQHSDISKPASETDESDEETTGEGE